MRKKRISIWLWQKLRHLRVMQPEKKIKGGALWCSLFLMMFAVISPAISNAHTKNTAIGIDAEGFSWESLSATGDGFLIKSSGQTELAERAKLAEPFEYIVEAGDTVPVLATRFGISPTTLLWANDIENPRELVAGSTLTILPISGVMHTVKEGETLQSIARRYGVPADRIAMQNELDTESFVAAGLELIVPGGRAAIGETDRQFLASIGANQKIASGLPVEVVSDQLIRANRHTNKAGKWMIEPVEGVYTSFYGSRVLGSRHWAVDIAAKKGSAILAAADGTVVMSSCGWNGGYGCMVMLDHGDNVQTLYAHLTKRYVDIGEKVLQGSAIGSMGNSGRTHGATGVHLHFEVMHDGYKKNPLAYYQK